MSFAKKFIEDGDYDKAIDAATTTITDGDAGPEPLFDRATAYDLAERYLDAVTDFEAAITLNGAEQEIDPFTIDDAYFSALLSAARKEAERDVPKAVTLLQRYMQYAPKGEHVADCADWQKRLRGELPSLLDKTKNLDAP
jgi:tetratricopeptide (TPR) repeat protein